MDYTRLRLELTMLLLNKQDQKVDVEEIIATVDKLVDFIIEGKKGKIKLV